LREREVLRVRSQVDCDQEMADALRMPLQSAKNHLTRIHRKLGVGSTIKALYVVGWVIPDDEYEQAERLRLRIAAMHSDLAALIEDVLAIGTKRVAA
jgi:hypothetical protein